MNTKTPWKYELFSDCTCEIYSEETESYELADTCAGNCFSDALEGAADLVTEWLSPKDLGPYERVIIYGTRLGWRSVSGYKLAGTEPEEIVRALFIDGDFTISLTLTPEGELTASRSSHDEYGAGFEFDTVKVCASSDCDTMENLTTNRHGEPFCDWHTETN